MDAAPYARPQRLPRGLLAICVLFFVCAILESYGVTGYLLSRRFAPRLVIAITILILLAWITAAVGILRARRYGWFCSAGLMLFILVEVAAEVVLALGHRLGLLYSSSSFEIADGITAIAATIVAGLILVYVCRPTLRMWFGFISSAYKLKLMLLLSVSIVVATVDNLARKC